LEFAFYTIPFIISMDETIRSKNAVGTLLPIASQIQEKVGRLIPDAADIAAKLATPARRPSEVIAEEMKSVSAQNRKINLEGCETDLFG
jgi:hypothetical protein